MFSKLDPLADQRRSRPRDGAAKRPSQLAQPTEAAQTGSGVFEVDVRLGCCALQRGILPQRSSFRLLDPADWDALAHSLTSTASILRQHGRAYRAQPCQ